MEGRRDISVYLVLLGATSLVFGRVLGYDFVVYDDYAYVAENPFVNTGLSWANVFGAFTNTYIASWFPLAIVSHIVDVEVYGLNAGGHHGTSLLLHLANTVLLFRLLKRLTGAHWRSAAVAGLFALHPLHVEPVVWISSRKDVLSTFLLIMSLMAYEKYARRPGVKIYAIHLSLFFLGLLAKSMLVTLPALLLLLDYWPLQRLQSRKALLKCVREKIPHVLMALLIAIATLLTQQHGGAVVSLEESSVATRLANAAAAYAIYLYATIWPVDLVIIYPNPGAALPLWKVLVSAGVLVSITGWVMRSGPGRRYLAVGWFWYLISLLPVAGLIQFGDHVRADRYTYVSLWGIFIAGVWELGRLASRRDASRKMAAGLAVSVLLVLAALSWRQTGYWRDSVTLFEHAVALTPESSSSHNNLGASYARLGLDEQAIAHYQEAIRLNGKLIEAYNNLGFSLSRVGRHEEALDALADALARDPNYTNAWYNRGVALVALGRHREAAEHFERVVRAESEHAQGHNHWGLALVRLEDYEGATARFREAVRLAPDAPRSHVNLGAALLELGEIEEARAAFERALLLDPDLGAAKAGLSKISAQTPNPLADVEPPERTIDHTPSER